MTRESLSSLVRRVLTTAGPREKAHIVQTHIAAWLTAGDRATALGCDNTEPIPSHPARPSVPVLLDSARMPSHKQLDVSIPVYLLHGLAHIELNAMDMYCDTVWRGLCGGDSVPPPGREEFAEDFSRVICDETRHFLMLEDRLRELGSSYGALPAHTRLWEHAVNTQDDMLGRLAVVPLVQEARGLDAGPRLVQKLKSDGDKASAAVVDVIVRDEVSHVTCGLKWFTRLCAHKHAHDPVAQFHACVRQYVPDLLPGPFNEAARTLATMTPEWYMPVSKPSPVRDNNSGVGSGKRGYHTSTSRTASYQRGSFGSTCNRVSIASSLSRRFSTWAGECQIETDGMKILCVFSVWPEPRSSAAGVRDVGLLAALAQQFPHAHIHIASPSKTKWEAVGSSLDALLTLPSASTAATSKSTTGSGSGSIALPQFAGVHVTPANGPEFEAMLKTVMPTVVLFDRLSTEEMFGWQVRNVCPDAIRILDTQDLHFLRHAREAVIVAGGSVRDAVEVVVPPAMSSSPHLSLYDTSENSSSLHVSRGSVFDRLGARVDVAALQHALFRELSAIMRSDLSLCVSSYEVDLLTRCYGIPHSKVMLSPLFYDVPDDTSGFRPFTQRQHFCMIGNWRHKPNADAAKYLKKELWPKIRAALPADIQKSVECHLYGAYASERDFQLSDAAVGLIVKGTADNQYDTLSQYRAQLAPLRFGAGVKGKITDGWLVGTPTVTTPIGSEGMGVSESSQWGGVVADTDDAFVSAAVSLYQDEALFRLCQHGGVDILRSHFDRQAHSKALGAAIRSLLESVKEVRGQDVFGQLLWHQQLRSTEYFSKYVAAKQAARSNAGSDSSAVQS